MYNVHQRIKKHEGSKMHAHCTEAYFLYLHEKDINTILFPKQTIIRKDQIKKKRQILERVIDIVKLIGKRGLSFRGTKCEAAYTLDDPKLDHGNFLELIILISKYGIKGTFKYYN